MRQHKNLWFKLVALVLTLVVLVPILAACGSDNGGGSTLNPNIVGKWTASAEDVSPYPGIQFQASFEFFKDWSYSTTLVSGITGTKYDSGDYSFPDDTHIRLKSPITSETDTFSLSGDTMTITNLDYTLTLHHMNPNSN